MIIKVLDNETYEEIYSGEVEEFLESRLYDDELERALNLLESECDEVIVTLCNNDEYLITKEIELIY